MEDQGIDPNLRDGDGATALHFAASRGCVKKFSHYTLHYKILISGHLSVVKWLISHGAKLSLDKYGKSPINDAAENQQTECLNVLVQHSDQTSQNAQNGLKYKNREIDKQHTLSNNFLLKCSSSNNSDSEPFYLHPPPTSNRQMRVNLIPILGNSNSNKLIKTNFLGHNANK